MKISSLSLHIVGLEIKVTVDVFDHDFWCG